MGQKKKFLGIFLFGMVFLCFTLPTNATIINTEVSVGMKISYDFGTNDATATDTGSTYASVNINGPVTSASAYSTLNFDTITDEEANLFFDMGYNGNDYPATDGNYMGVISDVSNLSVINYHADIDTQLDIFYDFDYTGVDPFGLNFIHLIDGYTDIITLGNVGYIGHHEGYISYDLLAGHDYSIRTRFHPNVSAYIGSIEGQLTGNISFDFNGAPVPEPATMLLLGTGLAGLVGFKRKFKK